MLDHALTKHPTTAQTVGVERAEDCYVAPINPNDVAKFWGVDVEEDAPAQMECTADAGAETACAGQSEEAAMAEFFAIDPKQRG